MLKQLKSSEPTQFYKHFPRIYRTTLVSITTLAYGNLTLITIENDNETAIIFLAIVPKKIKLELRVRE